MWIHEQFLITHKHRNYKITEHVLPVSKEKKVPLEEEKNQTKGQLVSVYLRMLPSSGSLTTMTAEKKTILVSIPE